MWSYVCLAIIILWIFDKLRRIPWVSGLHNKCVVITGCDSGFGNALAKSLYNKGVYVFAGCFTEAGASKLSEETGERLKTFILDVRKTESISKAYAYVRDNLPKNTELWGLVNNAGLLGMVGPIEIISKGDIRRTLDVNCIGMMEMVREFMPLIKRSRGRIVNMASVAGTVPFPGSHPYIVSKFALLGFSEALRHEKAGLGIKVATVCPGSFNTTLFDMDWVQARFNDKLANMTDELKEEYDQEYFDRYVATLRNTVPVMSTSDVSPVVFAYEHALFARYPYNKYLPGIDSNILVNIKEWLPTCVLDFLMGILSKRIQSNTASR